jgi:tetratricopeptide (TPR) repeat protein
MPFVKKTDSRGLQPPTDTRHIFIGRTGELLFFVQNILKPDEPTHNIISISGQGGVGKSTLLARFIDETHTADFHDSCLAALVDERQTTPVSMMEQFTHQLHITGKFEKALKHHKEVLRMLQTGQETIQDRVLRSAPDFVGAAVEAVPLAGPLLREGVKVTTRHLLDKHYPLQIHGGTGEDPVAELTRAFVAELNRFTETQVTLSTHRGKRRQRVILFFDTFEQLAEQAVPWLLDHFLEADISGRVVLVVAGRDPLEHAAPDHLKRWLPHYERNTIYSMSLNGFTEDETRAYLTERGITDPERMLTIWQLSRGLPLYLGLLTANPLGKVDPMKDVVENFLRWIPEQEHVKRRLALDGALFSRPFNLDDFEAFPYVSEHDRPMLYRWLSEQPFVRSTTQDGRYSYHDLAKELFSHHLYLRSQKEYYATRRALSEHYQRLLEEVHMAGGEGVDHTGEWLELAIAVAHQLFLLPDEVSHFKATVEVLNIPLSIFADEGKKGEIVKLLRELSRDHVTNLANPGARHVAGHMLQCIEAEPGSQGYLAAITSLLEKAVHVALFPPELLASLYSEQGWACFYLQSYQQAIADFERALELDSRCASAYNGRGWAYLNLTQYQQAKLDFDRALELDPNEAGAYNGRGQIYRAFKEHRQAKADFDRWIKVSPKNAYAYFQHGRTCTDLKEYQQAIADFDRALELDPSVYAAYKGLRQVYVELKEHQQAASIFDRLRETTPESPRAYTERGWTYWDLREHQQAIADFNHALELDPDRVVAYSGRGWAYRGLKEYQRAIADFHRVLELNPNHLAAYNGLGNIYRELKDYHLAIAHFNRIIEINPDSYWSYFQRGYTYLFLKDIRQARLDFMRSWELNSRNLRGRWMTEWSEMCKERHRKTTPGRLEAITAIDPQYVTAHVCQGVAWWLRGRLEEAMAELEQATLLDPGPLDRFFETKDPFLQPWDPYFWKGMICVSLRRDEEAIAAIEKSLELGLPPVLLAPLRWFEPERPDFYKRFVVPLLARYE